MTEQDSPIIPGTLGIHMLSGEVGESIIVTLPDGCWFVVDAFKSANRGHPTLTFIEQFGLAAEQCRFVLLTHLHKDHSNGIPQLLAALRGTNRELPFCAHSSYRHAAALTHVELVLREQEERQKTFGEHIYGVGAQSREVIDLCRKDFGEIAQWGILYRTATKDDAVCDVTVVSPAETIVNRFDNGVALRNLESRIARSTNPEAQRLLRARQSTIINDMSCVLLVRFGATRVLLGGDADAAAWDALAANPVGRLGADGLGSVLSGLSLVKVPHHGSTKASEGLTQHIDEVDAALTSHNRTPRYNLPTKEGLRLVLDVGATLGVPDRGHLDPDTREAMHDHELPDHPCRRIPISLIPPPGIDQVARIRRKYGPGVTSLGSELAWVSCALDAEGAVSAWFGGSQALFYR